MKKKLISITIISCLLFPVLAQEYINDVFLNWKNAGVAGSSNQWANGSQTIGCIDGVERTFTYTSCIINNIDATDAKGCPEGTILMRNSNNGILTFPELPNVGKLIVARQGKTADKNTKLILEVEGGGVWMQKETDKITATSGCEVYEFDYTSTDPVKMRLKLSGGSATRIYWIYVEGTEEGSRTPYIPEEDINIPLESTVKLLPNKADSIAFETLIGVSGYGWDPKNRGIYINWHRDYPIRINNTSGGDYEERNTDTRHDVQNDIRALQHYYWFKTLHDGTDFFDYPIKRIMPTVKSKFAKPSSLKGWMYFVLLRLHEYADTEEDKLFWKDAIMHWGNNVYKAIDPELKVYYQTNMGNCDCGSQTIYLDKAYRVDHQVESGAALVHAGTLFNKPEWVELGFEQVKTTYEHAFAEEYGVFGRIFLLGNSGYKNNSDGTKTPYDYSKYHNKLWDGQCKLGEASEEIDALLKAASVTTHPEIKAMFIEIAEKMLNALRDLPLHDKQYGGFFQKMYVADGGEGNKAGEVARGSKEMRQASLLGTYNFANNFFNQEGKGKPWVDMEKEMYWLLVNESPKGMYLPDTTPIEEFDEETTINGYRKTLAGYSYQLSNDWTIYDGKVPGNWVSNESNSLILLGIFEYLTSIYVDGHEDVITSTSKINNVTESIGITIQDEFLTITGVSWVDNKQIQILDVSGRLLFEEFSGLNSIDISRLKPGAYVLSIKTENNTIYTSKFIK